MGEHAVNPKDCTHGDGVIAVTTLHQNVSYRVALG